MSDSQDFEEQERRVSNLNDHENIKGSLAMFGGQMDEEESALDDEEELDEGEGEDEEGEMEEQQPLLFVDINLGGDEQERIVVFEGDTAEDLARTFCVEHNLDDETMEKLTELLKQQMAGVLPKIDEDEYGSDEDADVHD